MSNTNEILHEVGQFFKNLSWKNCLTFLAFLFLSTIFWIAMVYKEKSEMTYAMPIQYINTPDSIVFDQELPTHFNLTIKDESSSLMRHYALRTRKDSVRIDLTKLINELSDQQRVIIQSENIIQLIRERLQAGTELISYSPSMINTGYSVIQSKKIPVVYDGEIELANGFIFDGKTSIEPENIAVYATQRALDTIFFAHADISSLRQINKNINTRVPINKIEGARFKPDSVTIKINVDKFSNKEINVPITCINVPEGLNIKFFPSHIKVSATLGLKLYKDTKDSDFKIVLDYNKIKDLNSTTVPILITSKPEHALIQSLQPSEVEFILEKQ